MLRVLTFLLALVCARACSVCVAGTCHETHTLLQGFHVTDQMAIDRDNSVLYVQLDTDSNTALHLNPFKIVRLQHRNTSGMTVNQHTRALYTADYTRALIVHHWGQPHPDTIAHGVPEEPDLLFYQDVLYYTSKTSSGLYYIDNINNDFKHFKHLQNYMITDFVVNKNNTIYFVSGDQVYVYHSMWTHDPEIVATKKYTLSTDKHGDVYLGDASVNAIFKLDESNKLVDYAAYSDGSVDQFVFDGNNNIVFHDATSDSVSYWQSKGTKCEMFPPHDKYLIKDITEKAQETPEKTQGISEEAQEIPEEEQEIPEKAQGIPEEAQKIPEEAQEIPEEAQGISEEAQEISEEAQEIPEEAQEIPEKAQGGIPEEPQEIPEEAQGIPEEAQEIPEEAQEIPEEAQEIPEEAQEIPEEEQDYPEGIAEAKR